MSSSAAGAASVVVMTPSVAGALAAETGLAAEPDFGGESDGFWDLVDVVAAGVGLSAAMPLASGSSPSAAQWISGERQTLGTIVCIPFLIARSSLVYPRLSCTAAPPDDVTALLSG